MRTSSLLAVALCCLILAADSAAPADPFVKKATWEETMIASRARFIAGAEKAPLALGPWWMTGPWPVASFEEALFPEQGIDLDAKGKDGRPLWQARLDLPDGQVHNLPNGGRETTYLFRTIRARAAARIDASLGSDDGLELFLNGKKILSRNVLRGPGADQDHAVLDLVGGENRLLFKVHNNGGGHGFYFSLGSDPALPLWREIEAAFPSEAARLRADAGGPPLGWFASAGTVDLERSLIERTLREIGSAAGRLREEYLALQAGPAAADDPRWLALYSKCAEIRNRVRAAQAALKLVNLEALGRAIDDLSKSFPDRYTKGQALRARLDAIAEEMARGDLGAMSIERIEEIYAFQREALLSNPLLDFDRLLCVRRKADSLGLPQNWQGNCAIGRTGYDNEIAILSPVGPHGNLTTLFRPDGGRFVGDVDLHFDAGRMLVSMPGSRDRWQIWEIGADGKSARQVTPGDEPDVDNYDACYLPDERIIFASTRCFHGVPCVGGGNTVANFCIMDPDGSGIRQICFDQDHNWCPTLLNDGRVLYSRWEYSDSPHYFSRLLFSMNPDGTNQLEYYASNSMWPNSIFYARPIPNHPTMVVAVISGHHGVPRMGELLLFDPALGRRSANGAVQRIPGYGKKVEPIIQDALVDGSWPKFLHPFPLSEKYFLVSCQPTPQSSWGLYLVDIFDNILLLKEEPGYALFEPVPFRKTTRPPIIPDRVRPDSREAIVFMADVYQGPGLEGVPQGAVKKLRIYEPHYAYPQVGGHINIGIDGPWDVHRIHGTVPVEANGSAMFKVPANTPLSVQPLDADGRALQIMRSWFTAMPGENLSCVGCHESQNGSVPIRSTLASRSGPVDITPWYGPARGFSFKREVQPVLDRYCVGCHDGKAPGVPDFAARPEPGWRNFTPSYVALHPYVRRPGPESDYFLQKPLEFHAGTSELVQMLEKGHHGVALDAEAWDRLVTWIDLNVPDHGTWTEHMGRHSPFEERRVAMRSQFANRPENPETLIPVAYEPRPFLAPVEPTNGPEGATSCPDWPFDAAAAARRRAAAGRPETMRLDLGDGIAMDFALIPAGTFLLGDPRGAADERPVSRVRIERPFYLAICEVTNAQYARFDPIHDSAYISMTNKDQSERGHPVNHPNQPVIRIRWDQAMAFCDWLSARTGKRCTLPTEAQWEWACRAGAGTPFSFGAIDIDFSPFANLADASLAGLARGDSPQWHPRDGRFNDRAMVTIDVGRYTPNAWGLHDMHGNVAEWTRTAYRPYPYAQDGRDDPGASGARVVRGGSWYDRPARSRASFRLHYEPWQCVYNVGFRLLVEVD